MNTDINPTSIKYYSDNMQLKHSSGQIGLIEPVQLVSYTILQFWSAAFYKHG